MEPVYREIVRKFSVINLNTYCISSLTIADKSLCDLLKLPTVRLLDNIAAAKDDPTLVSVLFLCMSVCSLCCYSCTIAFSPGIFKLC